jgi:hypothetical protein
VYARVNDDFFIIIEDKTHTKTHDNQLARYRQSAQAMCEHEKRQLVCIYLKTGDESQASFEAIKHDGFAVVVRHDLLAFFKKHDVKNAIYEDFVENLQRIEDAVQSYMTAPIKDWNYFLPLHWYVWTGFFRFLETNFNGKNAAWHVAHPRDSFLYYYWGGKPINDGSCWIYLQIESNTGKLCFKIGTNDALFHEMLTQWHNIIKQHAQSAGMATIQRPERIDASGKTATIAIVNREDWLGADDAIFDANAVLERLEQYTKFLHQCLDDVK